MDVYLAEHLPEMSRSNIQRLIDGGHILVNSLPQRPSYKVRPGDEITVEVPPPEPSEIRPEEIPLDILYEDDHLVVVNKPPGMVVHPARGNWTGTLTSALAFRFQSLSDVGGPTRPGIVHRLEFYRGGLAENVERLIRDLGALREFTCEERNQFRILPFCDANGLVPDSGN